MKSIRSLSLSLSIEVSHSHTSQYKSGHQLCYTGIRVVQIITFLIPRVMLRSISKNKPDDGYKPLECRLFGERDFKAVELLYCIVEMYLILSTYRKYIFYKKQKQTAKTVVDILNLKTYICSELNLPT